MKKIKFSLKGATRRSGTIFPVKWPSREHVASMAIPEMIRFYGVHAYHKNTPLNVTDVADSCFKFADSFLDASKKRTRKPRRKAN